MRHYNTYYHIYEKAKFLIPHCSRRFASVQVNVPEVGSCASISSSNLLPFLYERFPLDEFSISFVPAALRSFIHHFWPAYTTALQDYKKEGELRITAAEEEEGRFLL